MIHFRRCVSYSIRELKIVSLTSLSSQQTSAVSEAQSLICKEPLIAVCRYVDWISHIIFVAIFLLVADNWNRAGRVEWIINISCMFFIRFICLPGGPNMVVTAEALLGTQFNGFMALLSRHISLRFLNGSCFSYHDRLTAQLRGKNLKLNVICPRMTLKIIANSLSSFFCLLWATRTHFFRHAAMTIDQKMTSSFII